MIDEKKLIEKLNRLESIVADYRSDVRQGYLNLICEIKDFVNEQPRVNQWIPCSERLPDKPLYGDDGYIVQAENIVEPYSAYWNGKYWTDIHDNEEKNIIAWMPLPEPYQEREDE